MRRLILLRICVVLAGFLLINVETCWAAGFYIPEVGTPSSLGTAGVANPTNRLGADSAYTNPAGMTGIEEDQIFSGIQVVLPKIEFKSSIATAGGDNGGNAGNIAPIPSFFYVKKLSDRFRFGFSVTAPLGGGVDYGSNFVGRYGTIRTELEGVGLSPSFAYKVTDQISVGAGVTVVYTRFEQEIAINQSIAAAPDGKLKLENVDGFGYQPFFSTNFQLSDRLLLGIVYRAEAETDIDGDVSFENLVIIPTPLTNKVNVQWNNPQWLEVGLSYKLTDILKLSISGGWQDWSAFSQNRLAFSGGALNATAKLDRNFQDTWHAGVAISSLEPEKGGFSLGFSYDSSPVEDVNRTFDLPFDEIYRFSGSYFIFGSKKWDYAVGGTLYMIGDAPIDETVQGVRTKGEFDTNMVFFLGATLRYKF
jgi:long-chain fatty acid transport protein